MMNWRKRIEQPSWKVGALSAAAFVVGSITKNEWIAAGGGLVGGVELIKLGNHFVGQCAMRTMVELDADPDQLAVDLPPATPNINPDLFELPTVNKAAVHNLISEAELFLQRAETQD